ncbi:MAG: hypothetical protein BroJett024_00210 [Alphaproteobacteria bacterium]|nr:MAG: hypothetical protein BroJett024_00210 [Alphaproteobacteria bacterium]
MVRRSAHWIGGIALVFLTGSLVCAEIGAADRKLLDLFGDVFTRVRVDYVDEARAEPWRLIDAAAQGLLKSGENTSRLEEVRDLRVRYQQRSKGTEAYNALGYFGDLFERLREPGAGSNEVMIRAAIVHMLAALDAQSGYIPAREFRDMQARTHGAFGGPGIEIAKDKEQVRVARPISGGPAERAGIMCGDIVTTIDGVDVAKFDLNRVVERLRGSVGSKVTLGILAPGRRAPFEVTIERRIVYSPLVEHGLLDDVGYLRIRQFAEQTGDQLRAAIAAVSAQPESARLKGYVVDLRDNAGGLLDSIVASADLFLDRGEIVSVRERNNAAVQRYVARPGDLTGGKPLLLLVNGRTASGAELLAAALQDHGRAKVVGTRTHGDSGTIQTLIPLSAGNGALRLTTARMYSPRGRSIAGGIVPDFMVADSTQAGAPDPREGCQSAGGDIRRDAQVQYTAKVLRDNMR